MCDTVSQEIMMKVVLRTQKLSLKFTSQSVMYKNDGNALVKQCNKIKAPWECYINGHKFRKLE